MVVIEGGTWEGGVRGWEEPVAGLLKGICLKCPNGRTGGDSFKVPGGIKAVLFHFGLIGKYQNYVVPLFKYLWDPHLPNVYVSLDYREVNLLRGSHGIIVTKLSQRFFDRVRPTRTPSASLPSVTSDYSVSHSLIRIMNGQMNERS